MDRLLTVAEVSERLKVLPGSIRRYIAEGRLPALRIPGGYYRIRERDLKRFLQPVGRAKSADAH